LNSARDTETKEDAGPLAGMRVLDFSWLLPGPFCTMQLADLGAEVIKVESPGGDYARDMLPGLFAAANRNKRSIIVDLKANDAADLVEALVRKADVVVKGFGPGWPNGSGSGSRGYRRSTRASSMPRSRAMAPKARWPRRSGMT